MKLYAKAKSRFGESGVYFGQEGIYVTDKKQIEDLKNVHIGRYAIIDDKGKIFNGKEESVTSETVFPSSFEWYKEEILAKDKEEKPKVSVKEDEAEESGESTPDMSWTKSKLQEYMDEKEISYNSGDTKQDLLDKIEWHNNK